MSTIFLSASVPVPGRGRFFETADPFLIQLAVRQLVVATIREWHIVWGGHPAITPMVWNVCEDIGVSYAERFTLYQSEFFESDFPEENHRFQNLVVVKGVPGDREASLAALRREMLSRPDLRAAVFVGGMEGVIQEYELFREYHPAAPVLPVTASGGAARELAVVLNMPDVESPTVDFARLFQEWLSMQSDVNP